MRRNVDAQTNSYQTVVLNLHNVERGRLGLPLLILDNNICQAANIWAKRGILTDTFQHDLNNKLGENIAWRTNDPTLSDESIATLLYNQWLEERRDFTNTHPFPNCKIEGSKGDVGHYTQIVWRNTRYAGFGLCRDKNWAYLVGRYSPAGNTIGQNVY